VIALYKYFTIFGGQIWNLFPEKIMEKSELPRNYGVITNLSAIIVLALGGIKGPNWNLLRFLGYVLFPNAGLHVSYLQQFYFTFRGKK